MENKPDKQEGKQEQQEKDLPKYIEVVPEISIGDIYLKAKVPINELAGLAINLLENQSVKEYLLEQKLKGGQPDYAG